jgi:Ca2+-binding EF-hand superfamily protein
MQDIIKKMKLDKNDFAFRLDIKPEKNEKLTFYPFKNKFRKFDFTFTNEFIEALYIELAGSLNDELYTNDLLDKLDVYKKGQFVRTNQDTFKSNFIENIQNVVDFHTLKNAFEKIDKKFTGKVPKNSFCQVIQQFTTEFKDEDILRLIRFLKLSDQFTYEVNYSQFLNIIYYNAKLDPFLTCIDHLKQIIQEKQFKTINELMTYLNNGKETNFLTVEQL